MTKSTTRSFAFLSLLAVSLLFSGCRDKRPISGRVPTVSLKTYSGETFTLSGEDRTVTLLVFWATWCQPCMMEMPALIMLHEKYRDRDFRVVSINVDDPVGKKATAIAKDYGINYPILIGNEDVMKRFGGVQALPTSFLIDRNGHIREKLQGLYPEAVLERMVLEAISTEG